MNNQFQWSNADFKLNKLNTIYTYWILRRARELNCLYAKLKYIYDIVPKEIQPKIKDYLNLDNNADLNLSEKVDCIIYSFVNYANNPLQGVLYNYIPSTRETWEDLVVDIWNNNYFIDTFDYI